MSPSPPTLLKQKHLQYWFRSLRTLLPHDYTSNDSQRMTIAFFILSSLDLLGSLHPSPLSPSTTQPPVTSDERSSYISWIYLCQHPHGGFRGSPGTLLKSRQTTTENQHWDHASLAATWFALLNLILLGDDLSRVDRVAAWRWLRRIQRRRQSGGDGSFGEVLEAGGNVGGGGDPRFAYFAAGVRWLLRGEEGTGLMGLGLEDDEQDIDVDGLVGFINSCEVHTSYPGSYGHFQDMTRSDCFRLTMADMGNRLTGSPTLA